MTTPSSQNPHTSSQAPDSSAPFSTPSQVNTVPASSAPQQVAVGSVAGAVTEYVDIPGKGAVKLASMTERAMARILDALIALVAGGLISVIFFVIIFAGASAGDSETLGYTILLVFVGTLFICVIALAYETVMVAFFGATLGKMAMKIKVVKSTTGNPPQILSAAVRYLVPGFTALIPIIGALGSLLCWISPTFDNSGRRQGWHDKVANTLVVSSK